MKKILIQGLLIIVLFISTLLILQQIDWMTIFKVQKLKTETEEKLGDLFWETFQNEEDENTNQFVINTLDSIVTMICLENEIDKESIKIHILNKDEINAFALPDGHLVVYSGLILASDNQEELSGVICHEIAHIELNHVMKKLMKELGLSVLISMTTGEGGAAIAKETAKLLSSSAFDRSLEKEADIKAVDYLIQAEIDPKPFADFLFRLSLDDNEIMKYLSWTSTHPDTQERAEYIIEYSQPHTSHYKRPISSETWELLKIQFTE